MPISTQNKLQKLVKQNRTIQHYILLKGKNPVFTVFFLSNRNQMFYVMTSEKENTH